MEKQLYPILYRIEEKHWWFKGRRKILSFFIENFIFKKNLSILDVGSSVGITMKHLTRYGKVFGVDSSEEAKKFCELQDLKVYKGDAFSLPFPDKSFDFVSALDLIEHLENDIKGIEEFCRVLKNDGYLVLSVPSFKFLWSSFDRLSHHYRRYSIFQLKKKIEKSGFKVLKISYVNFFLFPLFLIFRLFGISKLYSDLKIPPLNKILGTIFSLEPYFLKLVSFPWGSSIFSISKKV